MWCLGPSPRTHSARRTQQAVLRWRQNVAISSSLWEARATVQGWRNAPRWLADLCKGQTFSSVGPVTSLYLASSLFPWQPGISPSNGRMWERGHSPRNDQVQETNHPFLSWGPGPHLDGCLHEELTLKSRLTTPSSTSHFVLPLTPMQPMRKRCGLES